MPPAERIATFDQDGTLWVEHPMYTQVMYCLERVPAAGRRRSPSWRTSSRSRPCSPATARRWRSSRWRTSMKILAATLTGMTVDEFNAEAKKWLDNGEGSALEAALHRAHLPADAGGHCSYLRANGYKTTSSPAAARTSCASTPRRSTAFRPSRWSAPLSATEVRLRQGRQADPHQGAEAAAERQQCRQARRHPPDDRAPAVRGVRQLDRRSADAGVHRRRATARG